MNRKNLDRNAEIVRRRKAGAWPQDIARAMGLSRNTVIGVCNRAGLAVPGKQYEAPRDQARGERIGTSKLCAASVRAIRRAYRPNARDGLIHRLSTRFGVSPGQIANIGQGRSWAHVR